MSTKKKPVEPAKSVKAYIAGIFQDGRMRQFVGMDKGNRDIPFHEIWVWEERPTFSDPHYRRVTFHGKTHISNGWARYEGEFGVWVVDLTTSKDEPRPACTKVWGTPQCVSPSEEWRETVQARRERLAALFERFPMNEGPAERWSFTKEEAHDGTAITLE